VSVFAATSETDDYLQDPRGVRRYWPLRCGSIDLDALHAVRGQVFAEAVQAYQNSATWYVVPEIATLDEQRERITKDPWEGQVLRYCNAVIDANKLDSYVKVEVQIDPILSNDSALAIPKDRQNTTRSRASCINLARSRMDSGMAQRSGHAQDPRGLDSRSKTDLVAGNATSTGRRSGRLCPYVHAPDIVFLNFPERAPSLRARICARVRARMCVYIDIIYRKYGQYGQSIESMTCVSRLQLSERWTEWTSISRGTSS